MLAPNDRQSGGFRFRRYFNGARPVAEHWKMWKRWQKEKIIKERNMDQMQNKIVCLWFENEMIAELITVKHGQYYFDSWCAWPNIFRCSLFWCWYDCSIEIWLRSLLFVKAEKGYKTVAKVWNPINKIWWTDFRWVPINVSCKNIFNNNMHWEKELPIDSLITPHHRTYSRHWRNNLFKT